MRSRMLLRITAFVLGLALAPAYAAAPVDTQLSGVYANMLGEFSDRSITNDERYVRLKKHYAAAVDTIGNPVAASNGSLLAAFSMSEVMLLTELAYSQPLPRHY